MRSFFPYLGKLFQVLYKKLLLMTIKLFIVFSCSFLFQHYVNIAKPHLMIVRCIECVNVRIHLNNDLLKFQIIWMSYTYISLPIWIYIIMHQLFVTMIYKTSYWWFKIFDGLSIRVIPLTWKNVFVWFECFFFFF